MDSREQHERFGWTEWYIQFANKLLGYKSDRRALLEDLKQVYDRLEQEIKIKNPFFESDKPMNDVCPFTVFSSFNNNLSVENRIKVISFYSEKFDIKAPIPKGFDGIPVVPSIRAAFFGFGPDRKEDDIDNLWALFEAALQYADNPSDETRRMFITWFDKVRAQYGIKWNITIGLYWVRPFDYLSLDGACRWYLEREAERYGAIIKLREVLSDLPKGESYLELIDACKSIFLDNKTKEQSFPELSFNAWKAFNLVKSTKSKKERAWIVQANNNYYNIFGAVKDKDKITWSVKQYSKEVKKNDKVFIWAAGQEEGIIAAGMVETDPELRDDIKDSYARAPSEKVWPKGTPVVDIRLVYRFPDSIVKKEELKENTVLNSLTIFKNPRGTVFKVSPEQVVELEKLLEERKGIKDDEKKKEVYTRKDFLEEVFMDQSTYDRLVNLLRTKKNIILQGPPGVGKTFIAKRLAFSMIGEKDTDRVQIVQFHQSYSYEDFIMGYRPSNNGFELARGSFYLFCRKAEQDPDREYFFIIDEINRGNLSKILGELFMLMEPDKRGEKLRLLYSEEMFTVPNNVYIIGTMNTADRSLAMIDYALRRRFAFFTLKPAFESEGFKKFLAKNGSSSAKLETLINKVKELNEEIKEDPSLGEGFEIGHSYFCVGSTVTDEWLRDVVEFELSPLLKEYWFDNRKNVERWASELRSVLT